MKDYQFVWQSYTSFHSAATTQKLLEKCYSFKKIDHANQKSYENCYPFIYYLEHGQCYYKLANDAPLSIKPVLLFYGMVQLIKACLLTVDPEYPESTTVLAHGVSTRKRKKQSYEFFHDEVKIQKNGLFTHFSEKMFHMKHLDGEKYSMEHLLKRIPELNNLFYFTFTKKPSIKITTMNNQILTIPNDFLDSIHMTEDRFITYIQSILPIDLTNLDTANNDNKFHFIGNGDLNPLHCSPLLFHLYEDAYYLPIKREFHTCLPEIIVHYLLLYNLSMISRYETEWWSELLHTHSNIDYPFIQQFLSVTAIKVPYLLLLFLFDELGGGGGHNSPYL